MSSMASIYLLSKQVAQHLFLAHYFRGTLPMFDNYKSIEKTGNLTPYIVTLSLVFSFGFAFLYHLHASSAM